MFTINIRKSHTHHPFPLENLSPKLNFFQISVTFNNLFFQISAIILTKYINIIESTQQYLYIKHIYFILNPYIFF